MLFDKYRAIITTIVVVIASVFLCVSAHAETKVGVIIPELRAPFKIIFDNVVEGVDDELGKHVPQLILDKKYDSIDIAHWVQEENLNAVITLGRLGQIASIYVPPNIAVVNGALLSASSDTNRYPAIALTPDPRALIDLLHRLDNKRKKVIVVYNPSNNQWLVDLAKRHAERNGAQLVAYKATDIKQAAIIYDEIFSGNGLDDTALWLLQDSKVVDSKVVLPFILENAWQKNIVVFSSALGHVKKGVLFSMYPDNKSHGRQLARLVEKIQANPSKAGNEMCPTTGLQQAINSRTAEHLGLDLSRSELREFDVVFPVSN